MTKEEKKFVLNLNYQDLREYFLLNLNKLLKFLEEIRIENNGEETADIIEILISVGFSIKDILENTYFQKILCKLSKDKNHYQHENIALVFEELHSPKLIDCVYDLAIAKFDYMEYDEFFNIARKCTYALGYTNTPKAKEKLELLAKNENELIREYAIKQLNRHDFTDKDEEEHY
ncbi:HEAT repeat domain-containing protein [Fusobacterium nucleatum]|uniref:HEAT repeat domain-containing protein n=1 Tax=Fusobacterium nucleatum TaxID=851 RepID=UPI0003F7D45C|nr:HEAT repeat domain-containing protein [Fusobacterium nucleatum]